MKLTLANKVKLVAIPAIALAAGLSLAACGSVKAPAAAPAITHTVTAPAAGPKPTTPAPTTSAPAPYVQAPAPAREPTYFTSSTAVVQQFYQDINDRDYSDAWALGGDNIGGSDYAGWVAG